MMQGDKVFREVQPNCYDIKSRTQDMDNTGVTMQVLSTIPVLFNYWAKPKDTLQTSQFFNDHIATCVAKHPQQFIGLGTVPMQDTQLAIAEMERCIQQLGFKGLQIGTNINGENLNHSKFNAFFAAAEKLQCALFIHPWEMMGEKETTQYWLPWLVGMPAETSRAICSLIFGGVLEKYPTLKICFAHGGGSFPFTLGRIQHGFNVRPDLVAIDNNINPINYIDKFWIDSLVHSPAALQYNLNLFGNNKICLGSDYPFPLGEHHPGLLIEQEIIDIETKEKLLYKNALQWLGI
jgi:aminocarboxymuconate-semialdehyde decarboxylase